jgi:Na+/H+-dicarboxylate symporter
MMSLITALYILFDPIITSANVLGNGAFAKMIDSLVTFIHSWRTPLISVTEEEGK